MKYYIIKTQQKTFAFRAMHVKTHTHTHYMYNTANAYRDKEGILNLLSAVIAAHDRKCTTSWGLLVQQKDAE